MNVYLLMVLENEEYCNYDVFGVYDSYEKASKELRKLGGDKLLETWFNKDGVPQYYIDTRKIE